MKTLHIFFAFVLGVSFAFANNPVEDGTRAVKATNYNEVINNIAYPQVARENGIEGQVVILAKIDAEGQVYATRIVKSPDAELSKAVETAISKLQFEPAKNVLGMNVPSSVQIPVDFELTID